MEVNHKLKFGRFIGLGWGIVMLLFSSQEIISRLTTELSGTIISAETVHPEQGKLGNPNRYYVNYQIESTTGNVVKYKAKGSDSFLPRNLEKGTLITKEKWNINYSINNTQISDFPILLYGGMFSLGALLTVVGISMHIKLKNLTRRSSGTRGKAPRAP